MSPEQQRIAIAEACGWVWYRIPPVMADADRRYRCLFFPAIHEYEGQSEKWLERADGSERLCSTEYMWREGHVPDYLNDLNVMHEAEKTLTETEKAHYFAGLQRRLHRPAFSLRHQQWLPVVTATAAQRAEAFLRAKGLWTDAPKNQQNLKRSA